MIDRMMVKFGLSNSDVNFDKRAALLDKLEIAHHGDFLIYDNLNEPFDADLLAFVRVFKLPPGKSVRVCICLNTYELR